MGKYMSHPSGGPAWSRDRGYHKPDPVPMHVQMAMLNLDNKDDEIHACCIHPANGPSPQTQHACCKHNASQPQEVR